MHPEISEIGNKFFEQKTGKKKTWYAACALQYYPVASDADDETKDGCVLILNEHFDNINGIHSQIFDYTNAQLLVLKMQGYGNQEGKDGENEVDSDDDKDSISDDEDTDIKDGVFVFYRATTDRSLKEMFPKCRQFDDLYFRLCFQIWDCLNIYLVANPVNHHYYIRLVFKLMCMVNA
eukprot:11106224-Ditylum_brightwellii.AAC.1